MLESVDFRNTCADETFGFYNSDGSVKNASCLKCCKITNICFEIFLTLLIPAVSVGSLVTASVCLIDTALNSPDYYVGIVAYSVWDVLGLAGTIYSIVKMVKCVAQHQHVKKMQREGLLTSQLSSDTL